MLATQSVNTQKFLKISPWKYQRKAPNFKNACVKNQFLLGNFGTTYLSSPLPNAFRRFE